MAEEMERNSFKTCDDLIRISVLISKLHGSLLGSQLQERYDSDAELFKACGLGEEFVSKNDVVCLTPQPPVSDKSKPAVSDKSMAKASKASVSDPTYVPSKKLNKVTSTPTKKPPVSDEGISTPAPPEQTSPLTPGSSTRKPQKRAEEKENDAIEFLNEIDLVYDAFNPMDTDSDARLVEALPEFTDRDSYVQAAKDYIRLETQTGQKLYLLQVNFGHLCSLILNMYGGKLTVGSNSEFTKFCGDIGKSESRIMKFYIPFYKFVDEYPRFKFVTNKSFTDICNARTGIVAYLKKSENEKMAKYWKNEDGVEKCHGCQNYFTWDEDELADDKCQACLLNELENPGPNDLNPDADDYLFKVAERGGGQGVTAKQWDKIHL